MSSKGDGLSLVSVVIICQQTPSAMPPAGRGDQEALVCLKCGLGLVINCQPPPIIYRQLVPLITSTMYQTNSSELDMMTPSWRPSSRGAIAGTSFALLVLAVSERLLHATRAIMDAGWRSALTLQPKHRTQSSAIASTNEFRDVRRTIPPFVLSRDSARGALCSLHALVTYALMLAVMTFQAAYVISIIIGLGLGEVLFGRFANAHP
ncbi:Ctr copper transporter family-domain-containing protein [Russula earlei]|uniref:Ctr copper transporter family-domain-containing protein n=1 Tax=Russula earlei TaxID=71964 RepID=A0ACC0ULU8_9AGAM|nr:Ctr copper transporter family-domain-containing protein [Russula earlei]